ncbi:MAG: GDP-mannose 4,6-dehydratase [Candidatus Omnitrophica bacterium]|nr:GDP-mannose 4,6-dehydratase [Candidatus Omnitrophota bacterium]
MVKKALISGITGQDGSYLAEFLLAKGYEVHGLIRRASTFNTERIDHLYQDPHQPGRKLFVHYGDVSDAEQISYLIYTIKPDEIYHLAAQSHVRVSFDIPEYTGNITALGTTRLLEAIRKSGIPTKFYQASSSEMFGNAPAPQNENTPFEPRSPYACAKVYAHWMVRNYREGYGVFASSGIMFNHESPRRGGTFVTRKITRAIASILAGKQPAIYLGNLQARRDWGFAPEYVETMWKMLQLDNPDDFVIGTGTSHRVQDFLEAAFGYVDLDWKRYVKIDERYLRPLEVENLVADASRAKEKLGWAPRVGFNELVKIMVDFDMLKAGLKPPGEGMKVLKEKNFSWSTIG